MKVTFDTLNEEEVNEVVSLLQSFGMVPMPTQQIAVSVTETASEDENVPEPIPTQPEEVETSPEPSEKPKTKRKSPVKKSSVTLEELKELGRKMIGVTSREKVKAVIGEYAEKLTDVKTSDYEALAEKLNALGE